MSRKSIYTYTMDINASKGLAGIVKFTFTNGDTITVDTALLTPETLVLALAHGIKQKVADGGAIERDPVTGKSASLTDKITAMRAIADRLVAGNWRMAAGEGSGNAEGGLFIRALMELSGKPIADVRAKVATWSKAEQAAIRAHDNVAPIIARLRVVDPSINSDDLLNELI